MCVWLKPFSLLFSCCSLFIAKGPSYWVQQSDNDKVTLIVPFTCLQTHNLQGKVWNNWVCLIQTWHTAVINTGYNFIFRDFEKVFYSPGCMIGRDQINGIWIFSFLLEFILYHVVWSCSTLHKIGNRNRALHAKLALKNVFGFCQSFRGGFH